MLAGELYDASDPELTAARARARELLFRFNARPERSLLEELLSSVGAEAVIEPPFHCDYGSNISVGDRFYANVGCVFLDCAPISIGDRTLFGPAVQLCAATHPLDAETRRRGLEYALPIEIGDDVWIGGGAVVLPGITIGDRAVIGAGSVVVKDVLADVVAVGNPCRPVRELERSVMDSLGPSGVRRRTRPQRPGM
jgi:maltose O-acetyltransferase